MRAREFYRCEMNVSSSDLYMGNWSIHNHEGKEGEKDSVFLFLIYGPAMQ